ncbi:MAG: NUDIX hydrolase [Candidatus Peribacteraceae bacterium]|nr:NUDIX hydrolase [Candidatus Peribacteraceae bacterium]MDD5742758.1 NUDIX hydrolase [Candidatus Peribacteraceae bacterium]
MHNPFKTRKSALVWSCPWFCIREDAIILPDGKETTYWYAEKPDSVFIVPMTCQGDIVLIRSFRHPMNKWFWEIPAGRVEEEQSPEDAAREELREETGGIADSWQSIGRYCPNGGFLKSYSHIFLATGVVLGQPAREPEEQIEVHPTPIKQALEMVRSGTISSSQSALALLLCEEHLGAL